MKFGTAFFLHGQYYVLPVAHKLSLKICPENTAKKIILTQSNTKRID